MEEKEKWDEIVDIFNDNYNSQESVVQYVWENIFAELFNYSRLNKEIIRHKNMRLGSTERLITDIILKKEGKEIVVVELKQHNMSIDEGKEQQLFSYLKQMKQSIGILICDKIYLYSYDYNKEDNEQLKIEIELKKDNPDGIKFIELIDKNKFDKEKIINYIVLKNKTINNIKEIKQKITNEYIFDLIKKDLAPKYTDEQVQIVLDKINVSIIDKKDIPMRDVCSENYYLIDDKKTENYNKSNCNEINGLSKSKAIELIHSINTHINTSNSTFASLNKSSNVYWANPHKNNINQDWFLILNDQKNKKLHVFFIKAGEIKSNQLLMRNDKPYQIDLQIYYNDNSFTDSRSKYSFLKYYINSLEY